MPYLLADVDVTGALPALVLPPGYGGAGVTVRRAGRPVGFLLEARPGGTTIAASELDAMIRAAVPAHRLAGNDQAPPDPERLPSLTIAVCTKDHPDDLARCLAGLLRLRAAADGVELLVVDNAPSDGRTRALVATLSGVGYVLEPRPGLDVARNRALREARTELIAFVDDDVTVDRGWLDGLRRTLAAHPDAGAITGLVLPAELETDAQILFERRGGFEKKFETTRYGATLPGHPFYPCVGGKLGTGCNMVFRRALALTLGGFDEALDTGATLPGGGDSDMLYRVIRAGHPVVYEPTCLVFHRHRREYRQLRRQYSRSWARGLMAFVVKTYRHDPPQRANLRRLVQWWVGYELGTLGRSLRGRDVVTPDIVLAELWGGLVGLTVAYPRSVRRAERLRRRHAGAPALASAPFAAAGGELGRAS